MYNFVTPPDTGPPPEGAALWGDESSAARDQLLCALDISEAKFLAG